MTNLDIAHDERAHRLEVVVDGQVCELDYLLREGVMTIAHTGVPPAVEGRGIAGQLVRAAFELARARGWKVRPSCSYSAVWLQRHPEFEDLRA